MPAPTTSSGLDIHIGVRVRIARMTAARSRDAFAVELGVPVEEVAAMERGDHRFTPDLLARIAGVLGTTIVALTDDFDDPLVDVPETSIQRNTRPVLATIDGSDLLEERLLRAFPSLDDRRAQEKVIAVIEAFGAMAAPR